MKAYLLYEAGGTDKLILGEIEKPRLKSGEVLVAVKAIGINPADAGVRRTPEMITRFCGEERPAILGWDIAGEIVEKAADTDGFEIGDAVFALAAFGYAEYVAVPVNVLAHKPGNISYEEAAAVPIAGLTAWQPLMHGMQIKKGDRVLIHAGAGGVGHYGIQIAKHLGAEVITTSSAKNREFVLSLGADQHIDYTSQNFWEELNDIDFVLDTVGDTLTHSIEVTKAGGTIVTVLPPISEPHQRQAVEKNVHLTLGMVESNGEDLQAFANLMEKGIIKTHIATIYPFSDMAGAHTQVDSRRTAGKIVVKI